jgi:DNA-binding CsgD family transcriptional regulator
VIPGTSYVPPAAAALDGGELIERAAQLTELGAVLAAARDGITGVAVVEGAPGTGKSRLLRAAAALGTAAGMRVVGARGVEFEHDLAFGVAVSLLEPLLDGVPEQVRPRVFDGGAAAAAPLFGGGWQAEAAEYPRLGRALARALRQLVRHLADDGGYLPLLLTVDDLHWCDVATLSFLTQLCSGTAAPPLAIVLAARGEAARPARERLAAMLSAAPTSRALRLGALSAAGAERLVRGSFPDAAPEFAAALGSLTAGNPFYLRELIERARKDGIAPTADGTGRATRLLPEPVVRSVLARLAALPPPAAAVASAAAVLGDGASLRHAALLAEADLAAAGQAADALAAAGVLRPGEPLAFDCPLTRSAVYAEVPAFARARMHRAAAALLDADGAAADEIAPHLLASGPAGDRRSVRVLRAAAATAAGRGRPGTARRLLLRALAEPPSRGDWPAVVQELAVADAQAGAPEAIDRVREALSVAGPDRRADLLRVLARLLVARSEFTAAADTVGQALAALPAGLPATDPRARDAAVEALAIAGIADVPPPPAAGALLSSIMADASAGTLPSDPACLAYLAAMRLAAGSPADSVAAAARAALDRMPVDDGFYGLLTGPAAITLIAVDDYQPVRDRAAAMLGAARTAGIVITEGMVSHWLSLARYRAGDLTGAIEAGRRTLAVADAGWDVCAAYTRPVLAHAYLELGDTETALRVLPPAGGPPPRRPEDWVIRAARARLTLESGDPGTALAELLAVGAHAERAGLEVMLAEPWRPAATLAALAVGDAASARSLALAEVAAARAAGAPRRLGIALRVAGITAGPGAAGLALAREAVAVLEASPARLELARALVGLGVTLRRSGQPAASRDPLRRGLDLATELAAAPLAERAVHELRAAGGRRRTPRARSGPAALTPAERSVAALAAAGQSTPQIANRLSVTQKTVDWHLGNAYRKLGISSRRELGAALEARA